MLAPEKFFGDLMVVARSTRRIEMSLDTRR
jgi:hypothetical protein